MGRGASIMEAIGNWLHNNRTLVGVEFEVDPSAVPYEMERRRLELAMALECAINKLKRRYDAYLDGD